MVLGNIFYTLRSRLSFLWLIALKILQKKSPSLSPKDVYDQVYNEKKGFIIN